MPQPKGPRCPACSKGYGKPVQVSASTNGRTIIYRCPQCQHRWTLKAEDDH